MILSLVICAAAWEAGWSLRRHRRRTALYKRAAARARTLHRPLVVVGDPDAGGHTKLVRAYGCGDACADLHGCPRCSRSIRLDLTKGRLPYTNDSAVVFASCVLEYVTDVRPAWHELLRVAGSADNLFVVRVEPWTLTSRLFPGARRIILEAPPEFLHLRVREIVPRPGEGRL